MKAIRVPQAGAPEVLTLVEVPTPTPGPDQVLVRVAASGVNFMDVGLRLGRRAGVTFPLLLGGEAAGTVEATGSGVARVRVGDRVMFAMTSGTYAEYALAPERLVIRVPDDYDLVDAAAVPLQGMTAQYLLHEYRTIGPGATVLVHAVAGGMGLLLTQWARHLGARVIGTTSSPQKAANAKAMGAHDVIIYTEQNFAEEVKRLTGGEGADLILDSVGKATFPGDLEAVKIRGHIVVYGSASGQADPISPNAFSGRAVSVSGAGLALFTRTPEEIERRSGAVLAGIREGWLKITIDRKLPLAQAVEAHRALEGRQTSGKLLLVP